MKFGKFLFDVFEDLDPVGLDLDREIEPAVDEVCPDFFPVMGDHSQKSRFDESSL